MINWYTNVTVKHKFTLTLFFLEVICSKDNISCFTFSKPCLSRTPFGTEEFIQLRQIFGLLRVKLHRHLVDGI